MEKPLGLRSLQRTVKWQPSIYDSEWNKCTKLYTVHCTMTLVDEFGNAWPLYRSVLGDWASVTLDEIKPLRARSTLRPYRSSPCFWHSRVRIVTSSSAPRLIFVGVRGLTTTWNGWIRQYYVIPRFMTVRKLRCRCFLTPTEIWQMQPWRIRGYFL